MFRRKPGVSVIHPDQYLPELRSYVREHYKPKPPRRPEVKYSLPVSEGKDYIRFSTAETEPEKPPVDGMPYSLYELQRDLALLDSPAMQKYYHSWEKKKSVAKTFSSEVIRMVGEKYRKPSAFYIPAGIDKRTFHRMRSDYLYKPSRSTAVKCCLGLKLGEEEAGRLMQLAGYSFSPSDPSDLVVLFCIEKKIWDLASVNYLMDSFDLKDLDGQGHD